MPRTASFSSAPAGDSPAKLADRVPPPTAPPHLPTFASSFGLVALTRGHRQAEEDDAELSETQTAEEHTSNSEAEQDSEPDAKRKRKQTGGAGRTKSAIAKPAQESLSCPDSEVAQPAAALSEREAAAALARLLGALGRVLGEATTLNTIGVAVLTELGVTDDEANSDVDINASVSERLIRAIGSRAAADAGLDIDQVSAAMWASMSGTIIQELTPADFPVEERSTTAPVARAASTASSTTPSRKAKHAAFRQKLNATARLCSKKLALKQRPKGTKAQAIQRAPKKKGAKLRSTNAKAKQITAAKAGRLV